LADDERTFKILANALKASITPNTPRAVATALSWRIRPTFGVSIRDAFFSSSEMVSATKAIGRISADLIAPYPPGVPVVTPGEVLTEEILTGLAAVAAEGVRIAYSTDSTLATYRVLAK
jgi:lysine decarboxylase